MNPASIIRRSARSYANNIAVWFEAREQTYGELFERACRLANVFRAAGAVPGDRVAMLGDNAFETIELAAACALGNYPRATLYTYHAPAINRYLIELTGARVVAVQAKYVHALMPLLDGLTELRAIIVFGGAAPPGTLSYDLALADASAEDVEVPIGDEDPHIIRFSSGTTGKPKGIWHSNARWAQYNSEWRWVTPMISERSRYFVPCALAHLGVAFLWGILAVGGRIVHLPAFEPALALELLETQKITHAVLVPVMIREMLQDVSCGTRDFSALQCLMYSGSPIAAGTLRSAIAVFGEVLYQMYGQSEVVPVTMLLPHQHVVEGSAAEVRRLRSVGRATPNVGLTIRGEDGCILAVDEIGEIAANGPAVMSGLWNDPQGTVARTLSDGSILTGDMGYLDADGFLYLVDRKNDMIVSGGFNIWPTELEQALSSHPAVAEASVFGVPDEKWGETPKASVVLRDGSSASAEELIGHVREIVGSVKKVTSIDFVAALPRTATGKVQRNVLKDPYWANHTGKVAGS